jgi:GTP-binding protein HflX
LKSFFEGKPTRKVRQRAVVVGVYEKAREVPPDVNLLEEIVSLCRTAGARVVGRIVQFVDRFSSATMIGSGKVDELERLAEDTGANLAVFDARLSPSQQMNLEKSLGIQVIDRPGLILDIFAIHARSREAQVQVELAQLEYLLPRLAGGWTHLERQEGAIGTRGPGETQLETDRRLVRKRIRDLKGKLKGIESERRTQRKARGEQFKVCLVGYTNAGKSTIFNHLTRENVIADNYLFATLDSTTRRIKISGRNEILLSDTVGFIKRLPVSLIASFKSTLMEASGADLLLHVIDIDDPDFEQKIGTVNEILGDIECRDVPVINVFNKTDRRDDPDLFRSLLARYPGSRFVSAVTGDGMDKLVRSLETMIEDSKITVIVSIDPGQRDKINLIGSLGHLLDSAADDGVLKVKVKLPRVYLGKLRREGIEFIHADGVHGTAE